MDAEYVGYSGDWICDEHGVCTPANLVKYEVEETQRWVDRKLAQIRREEDIERNNRADEMERLQLELEKKKLEIIQAQRLKETELQSERFNALTNTVKGFSFKDPSAKSAAKEPVDTNYTGKSVLSYLLQLEYDLLEKIVKLLNPTIYSGLLFQPATDLNDSINKALGRIWNENVHDELQRVKDNLPPKEPITPPYYEEDIVQPIIK